MKKILTVAVALLALSGLAFAQKVSENGETHSYRGIAWEELNARLEKNTLLSYPLGYSFTVPGAEKAVKKALTSVYNHPKSFNAVFNYATVLSAATDDEMYNGFNPAYVNIAIEHFTKAIKMNPNFAQAYAGRADMYVYRAHILQAPGYSSEADLKADIKAHEGAARAALADYIKADQLGFSGRELNIAELAAGLGNKTLAAKYEQQYAQKEVARAKAKIAKNPNDASAYYDLANAYENMGKTAESAAAYKKARELSDKETAARRAKEQESVKKALKKSTSKAHEGNKGSNFTWLF